MKPEEEILHCTRRKRMNRRTRRRIRKREREKKGGDMTQLPKATKRPLF